MNATQILVLVAGALLGLLGVLHATLTLRDFVRPTAFTPTDDAVRRAMAASDVAVMRGGNLWRAWLGFHLTHSLGLVVFAGVLLVLALAERAAFADHPLAALATVAVAGAHLTVSARFFFSAPTITVALSLVCLIGAWLTA
jgi:hypothetical protein